MLCIIFSLPKGSTKPDFHRYFQLCEKLGIVEKHYFGLTRSMGQEVKAWLNLRNPLMTQLRPHITGKPHRLRLDVKFYVLPQEIQHEKTR